MSIPVDQVNHLDDVKTPTSRKGREKWGTQREGILDIPFDPEYAPGAFNAVRVCLRVQPEEQVCVITDEATVEIAAAIVAELEKLGAPYHAWVLEDLAERPLKDLPREIMEDLEISQVCAPDQCGDVVNQDVANGRFAASPRHGKSLDPIGSEFRSVFFVEELAADTIRVALHGHRTIFEMRQQKRGDAHVVIDDMRFGETRGWIEHFVGIRNRNDAAFDVQLVLCGFGQAAAPSSHLVDL